MIGASARINRSINKPKHGAARWVGAGSCAAKIEPDSAITLSGRKLPPLTGRPGLIRNLNASRALRTRAPHVDGYIRAIDRDLYFDRQWILGAAVIVEHAFGGVFTVRQ